MAYGQQRGYQGHRGGGRVGDNPSLDLSKVVLKKTGEQALAPELFSGIAEAVAKTIGCEKSAPKPTQVRKFFDELVMWEERARQDH